MMPADYLAIVCPGGIAEETERHSAAIAARRGLEARFRAPDLLVFASLPTMPLGDTGCMIGHVFGVAGQDCADLAAATRQSGGRLLIERCWGEYLALSRAPTLHAVMAIRSPSGGLPAFRVTLGPVTLLSSNADLLIAHGVSPAIDWAFVQHYLAFPHLRGQRTGLAAIDEILGGECLTIERGTSWRRTIWTPWHYAAPERAISDRDAASDSVGTAVLTATAAMARPFERILLELSGGLDSSVLAASLTAAGIHCQAANLATPGPEGDERRYARAVVETTGHGLIEAIVDADLDLTAPVWGRTVRPGIPAMLRAADDRFLAIARDHHCDAFFSGSGGDCVFGMPDAATPAADALLSFGFGRRFARTTRDIADVHDASVWRALRLAWRSARSRPQSWPRSLSFLRSEHLPQMPEAHPWLREPAEALPGKRAHVRAILATLGHLDGYARQAIAPSAYPLLSQPVLEACLRIPSWLWVDGGRDRAIARHAFRDRLPAVVLDRRTKGAMDAYCVRNYDRNRPRLDGFLGRGHLAAAGLVDVEAIGAFLAHPPLRRDTRFYELLPIIDCEAWLRGWLGAPD